MSLKSKFRGCLLGALIGDCYGAFFEGDLRVGIPKVLNYIKRLENDDGSQILKYTDDSCMTLGLATSLVKSKSLIPLDIAQQFTEDFYASPNRGYGANIGFVFRDLKASGYRDIYGPASRQFNGSGSFGNGGGMRISPLALWGYKFSTEELKKAADDVTRITHTNSDAIEGAWLQCASLHYLLHLPDSETKSSLDWRPFLEHMESVLSPNGNYSNILVTIGDLLERGECGANTVVELLGHGIGAIESIPTALFCFLRSQTPIPGIPFDNVFQRCLVYSLSLGGDTDTIGSMACALAGAQVGIEGLPSTWVQTCEASKEMTGLADDLTDLVLQDP